ncbi:hypothetical protein [Ohessyouella blattaphilus]|uniref:Uncharacterized protein n=1 Tax=Ohessyouella blattaphilus TaxID=2949333 RepID=A0ABT1EK77_9FIRM|nr:hypothetical protein [Ohessyouella blattaphilus]MCP1111095.1 hypothetical protein [Ohessyouella blattaphilus]MCR8564489.1 hypothetical protein [Ohessyouella blattaphilus]
MLYSKRYWRPGLILKLLFVLLFLLILGIQAFSKEEIVYTEVKPQVVGSTADKAEVKRALQGEQEKAKSMSKDEISAKQSANTEKDASLEVTKVDAETLQSPVKAITLAANKQGESTSTNQEIQSERRWIESQTKIRERPTIVQEARTEVITAEYRTEYFMACSVCHVELTNDNVNPHTEAHMLAGEGGGSYQSSRNVLVREEQVIHHEAVWGTKTEEYMELGYWEYY